MQGAQRHLSCQLMRRAEIAAQEWTKRMKHHPTNQSSSSNVLGSWCIFCLRHVLGPPHGAQGLCSGTHSYSRHASPPPSSISVAPLTGVMGGWSPTFTPPAPPVLNRPCQGFSLLLTGRAHHWQAAGWHHFPGCSCNSSSCNSSYATAGRETDPLPGQQANRAIMHSLAGSPTGFLSSFSLLLAFRGHKARTQQRARILSPGGV